MYLGYIKLTASPDGDSFSVDVSEKCYSKDGRLDSGNDCSKTITREQGLTILSILGSSFYSDMEGSSND